MALLGHWVILHQLLWRPVGSYSGKGGKLQLFSLPIVTSLLSVLCQCRDDTLPVQL